MYIGVFDSGIGGLTVLRAFLRELPNYTYVYYGDNANAPYGEKSPSEIYDLTIKSIEFLFAKNCSLVILACNTASTVLPRIQQEWLPAHYPDRRVLGIIRPTSEHIVESGEREIYLMATPATVNARSYEKEILKLQKDDADQQTSPLVPLQKGDPALKSSLEGGPRLSVGGRMSQVTIHPIPAPGLAKAIEDSGGKLDSKTSTLLIKCLGGISSMIPLYLGCTHYELLEDAIRGMLDCEVFHQSDICALALSRYLDRHKGQLGLKNTRFIEVYASQNQERFRKVASTTLA